MKLTGLITEYNPFHNGHLHHLKESIRITDASHTVAIMSGHFLQRGEIALCDKWSRAEAAVKSGVDLVFELPSVYACASAEHFARGAVMSLTAAGCDAFCFGSETGSLDGLYKTALALSNESPAFKARLKSHLKAGLSYPAAREIALGLPTENAPDYSSNNILGIEYLKAAIQTKSSMTPYTINRLTAAYHETELTGAISSATAIRRKLEQSEVDLSLVEPTVPAPSYDLISALGAEGLLTRQEQGYAFIKYQLLSEKKEELSAYHEFSEGLENRIFQCVLASHSLTELIDMTKTKRYTRTRIQRALMNMLLKRKSSDLTPLLFAEQVPYLRVLAFNQKGREILRTIKKNSTTPLLTNPSRFGQWTDERRRFFDEDVKSTNVYRLVQGSSLTGEDYTRQPIEVI